MYHYLIVWHETDGNDVVVYDTIIRARSEENATRRLFAHWLKNAPGSDEDDCGITYPCDCNEDQYCEGHGGTFIREIETYKTRAEADNARRSYHSLYSI